MNEDLERKMTLIVEQQAQFATDVQPKIDALVGSQIRTDENVSRTDESLRNLIAVVDRYFSERRKGG
ncbi:MAG TPA: hypothetical protein VIW64_06285 [Pyrinomonadaceae bacterium]|jgi:hypothetical protein